MADDDRNVADDQRRASYADVSPNQQQRDPKADFFHKLVAKVTTEDNDDEAERVKRSTTSLDGAAAPVASVDENEKTASTSSLNIDAVDKTDGRPNKFSELSRSNACLESATASASASSASASALKYASCFSISRMKAHNIASYNEFNQETEQVRL